jgi:hypothetical protein
MLAGREPITRSAVQVALTVVVQHLQRVTTIADQVLVVAHPIFVLALLCPLDLLLQVAVAVRVAG